MASKVESASGASAIERGEKLPIPKRRHVAWWVYVVLLLAILALGIGGFYSVWYFSAKAELDNEITEARRRGEPVWFAELEPPPVPPEENGALLAVWADERKFFVSDGFMAALERAKQIARYGDSRGRRTVDEPEFRSALDALQEQLAVSHQAIAKPHFRWRYDYQTKLPINTLIPHVQGARNVARLLAGEFHLALAAGDFENALQVIEEQYALAELLREEWTLIAQLVRINAASLATDEFGILLGHAELSDEQFSHIDRRLKEMEAVFRLRECMLAERASLLTTMENLSEVEGDTGIGGAREMSLLPPLVMRDQAFAMRYMRQLAEAADRTGPAGQVERKQLDDELRAQVTKHPLASMLIPASTAAANAGLRHRQSLLNARLGLRVDRYWRKNGRLPGDLADVLDEDLKELPKCLFSDLPPILKPDGAAGFVVYTPCENGQDDGADASVDRTEGASAFRVIYVPARPDASK